MSWDAIAANPDFQALPEERQQRVRENYFRERVAPNVPEDQMEQVRASFMAYRPKPLPPGAVQVARQAGQLLGHAARAASDRLASPVNELTAGERRYEDAAERLGYPKTTAADFGREAAAASREAVDALSKSAKHAAKELGVDPDDAPPLDPAVAHLGVNEPLHAFQAVLDKMLPEVAELGKWKELAKQPLARQLDFLATPQGPAPTDQKAVAPRAEPYPVFDLPMRRAVAGVVSDPRTFGRRAAVGAATPISLLDHLAALQKRGPENAARVAEETAKAGFPRLAQTVGVAAGLPTTLSEVLTPAPATVGEAEQFGLMAAAPEATRLVGNEIPGLRADVGGLWRDFLGQYAQAAYRVKKAAGIPQHLDLEPVHVAQALREGRISLADAARADPAVYQAELAKRVPENTNQALAGAQKATGAAPDAVAAAAADADRAGYASAHDHVLAATARDATHGLTLKPLPATPADIARTVIGAHAVGPVQGHFASQYPHLYAAATGAAVPQALVPRFQELASSLDARGVPEGPMDTRLAMGAASGQVNLVELAELNEALHADTLKAAGVHPNNAARLQADAATAAQRPGPTLVAEHMRQQAEQAAAEARAFATKEVWREARRVLQTPQEQKFPTRSAAVRLAAEEGLPTAEVARSHRDAALERLQAGTLPEDVRAEYADDPGFGAAPPPTPPGPLAVPPSAPAPTVAPPPAAALLQHEPLSAAWLKKVGLSAELPALRARGLAAEGGLTGPEAVRRLIQAKHLMAGAGVRDLLNLLETEAAAPAGRTAPAGASATPPPAAGTPPASTAGTPVPSEAPGTPSGTPSGTVPIPLSSDVVTPQAYLDSIRQEVAESKLKFGKEAAAANWVELHPDLRAELERAGKLVKPMDLRSGVYTDALLERVKNEAVHQFQNFEPPADLTPKQRDFFRASLERAARRYVLATGEEPPLDVMARVNALRPAPEAPSAPPADMVPAFRDPDTGQVYTGPNHAEIAKSIPNKALRARAMEAADKNTDQAGFVAQGEYINRSEAQRRYGVRTSQELAQRRQELAAGGARADEPPASPPGGTAAPGAPPPREGGFAGTPVELPKSGDVMPLEMPELVRLSRELLGSYPEIAKRLGRSRGLFIPSGQGKIKLRADLFADVDQAAKTLAHELGHADDYLPDKTMARGNLIGRIMSFKKFMKGEFQELNDAVLRKELKALSAYWRPWDRGAAPPSYVSYRDGSDELFADAVSAFLNSPGTLEKIAPSFYRALLDHMDRKPEFKAAWLDIQDLLRGSREDMLARRRQDIREMGMKSEEILVRKQAEKQLQIQSLAERAAQVLTDRYYPVLKAANELEAMGVPLPDHLNPKYVLQEGDMGGNEKALLDLNLDKVLNPLWAQHGLGEVELHEYMFNNRILHDRSELGNPLGTTPSAARENLAYLERTLGAPKYAALVKAASDVQNLFWPVVEEAHQLGVIGEDIWTKAILPNKGNYVTFSVLEHLEKSGYISAGVAQQVGTFKEVGNTFLNTRLKTQAMMQRNLDQKNKLSLKAVWDARFPGEMKRTEVVARGGGPGFERPEPGKEVIRLYEDGKPVAYDVDPYIAEAFAKWKPAQMSLVHRVLNPVNQTLKLMYTSWNAGFAGFSSPVRYFQKTYKGLSGVPGATAGSLLAEYVKALPAAYKKSIGIPDELVQMLLKEKALDVDMAELELVPSLNSYATKLKARQLLQNGESDHGLGRRVLDKMLMPARQILHGMQVAADTMTSAWKIAAAKIRIRAGETGKEMAYNVRNYAGVPNPRVKGLAARTLNDIFLFSNIGQRHYMTAWQVLTQPKTRGGAALKTAALDVAPSLLQTAALLGVFGVGLQEFYKRVSKYHLRHYTVLPMGHLQGGEWKWKAVYLPLPHDDAGRIVHAMTHEVVKGIHDRDPAQFAAMMGEIFSIIPSKTPALGIPQAWIQEYTGGRYWDDFRQRTAIPDRVEKIGGLLKLEKMVEWTLDSSGMANFSAYDPARRTTTEIAIQATPLLNRLVVVSDYGMTEDFRRQIEGTPNAAELYKLQEKKRAQKGILSQEERQRMAHLLHEAKQYKRAVKQRQREAQTPLSELREEIRKRVNP